MCPICRGAPEKQKREYLEMYEGTRHILPARGDNPRPNVFHMGIHVLFLVNLCLAVASPRSRRLAFPCG